MILAEDGLTLRGEGDEATIAQIRALLSAPAAGVKIRLADLTATPVAAPVAPPEPAPVAPPPPAAPVAPPSAPVAQPAPVAPPAPVVAAPAAPAPEPKRPLSAVEAACQQKLAARIAGDAIKFRTASADIDKASGGVIADLARVLQGCPEAKVEIEGHTDNVGKSDRNKKLSQERAKAVVRALVAAGVAEDRLSSAGYGEERPIAPNVTRDGRAQNRRTEFVVK
jgi:OOP family OmpA-OmpF porin